MVRRRFAGFRTIRGRMLFWILAATMPIYAGALYMSYQATAQRLEDDAERDADELAARLAAGMDAVIRPIEGGIRTVASQLEEIDPPRAGDCRRRDCRPGSGLGEAGRSGRTSGIRQHGLAGLTAGCELLSHADRTDCATSSELRSVAGCERDSRHRRADAGPRRDVSPAAGGPRGATGVSRSAQSRDA